MFEAVAIGQFCGCGSVGSGKEGAIPKDPGDSALDKVRIFLRQVVQVRDTARIWGMSIAGYLRRAIDASLANLTRSDALRAAIKGG